jgi:predicted metal-binding membrane protein
LLLSGCAWLVMLAHYLEHRAHGVHHVMRTSAEATHWLLMVVAMMFPVLDEPLRTVAFRSFRERRLAARSAFLLAYLVVWGGAGAPVVWLRAEPWSHDWLLAALAFVLAAGWTRTPLQTWGERVCHAKRPLAAAGWRAHRDVLAYGARFGVACVATGWPLMLACSLTGHAPLAMLGGTAAAMLDRFSFRPLPRHLALLALGLGAWCAANGVLERKLPSASRESNGAAQVECHH